MEGFSILEQSSDILESLEKGGAFLTVQCGQHVNTMTIGWGAIGVMWGMRVFIALVRPMRYTHQMLAQNPDFTVSIPSPGSLSKELAFAGTKSGRDMDKFSGNGITAISAQEIKGSIIAECPVHIECKTMLMQDITDERMHDALKKIPSYRGYSGSDFHTLYFGRIVAAYRTDDIQ